MHQVARRHYVSTTGAGIVSRNNVAVGYVLFDHVSHQGFTNSDPPFAIQLCNRPLVVGHWLPLAAALRARPDLPPAVFLEHVHLLC